MEGRGVAVQPIARGSVLVRFPQTDLDEIDAAIEHLHKQKLERGEAEPKGRRRRVMMTRQDFVRMATRDYLDRLRETADDGNQQ